MTKKHFIILAARLKFERATPTGHDLHDRIAEQTWRGCVDAIADVCQQVNARFDRARFLTACGADVVLTSHRGAMERAS